MLCPTCVDTELEARFSHGFEVDVCPNCSGAWLDRGELDSLIALMQPSTLLATSASIAPQDGDDAASEDEERKRPQSPRDDDDDDRKKKSKKHKSKHKKRKSKSWGDRLEDILDDVLDL